VTTSSSNINNPSAAAVAFAKKGANVVVAGPREEAGKALVKELRSFGSEAEFINADLRRRRSHRRLKAIPVHASSTGITQGSRLLRPTPRSMRNRYQVEESNGKRGEETQHFI
jgi:NADP-dependent 3-hydroxy acid dehydrogenase YdfG